MPRKTFVFIDQNRIISALFALLLALQLTLSVIMTLHHVAHHDFDDLHAEHHQQLAGDIMTLLDARDLHARLLAMTDAQRLHG